MKVGFLVEDMTEIGGIERVVCKLANYFATEYKYEVKIISLIKPKNDGIRFQLHNNVEVIYINHEYEGNFIKKHITGLKKFKKIFNEIDLDVLFSMYTKTNVYFSILKNKIKPRVIACQHGQYYFDSLFFRAMERIFYRRLDIVVLLTERDEKIYKKFCRNTQVIPNPLPFNGEGSYDSSSKTILSLGRLSAEKSVNYTIEAFSLIHEKNPDWKLEIVGDGPEKEGLIELTKSLNLEYKVIFSGLCNDVKSKYDKAAFTVLTSQSEAFPMVLIESKACGIPALSFDIRTGPREIIKDGNDGIIVPQNNTKDLAEAMDKLMNDKDLRISMAKNSLINSREYFVENIAFRWKSIIEEKR
ncbi:glycosyltransferase family 4 protein [Clostridium hydrogeniformans]|uniref:glycosyltransferase family 4 protein n=1 Tax=Clostridium hydrogeniformans TaxID=349933 RepID=UPI00048458E5|nr:glycosyltransferase family 4 protein [Clostridium hydrogeniformans]